MSRKDYRWVYSPQMDKPKISVAEKDEVKDRCDQFIERELKPKYLKNKKKDHAKKIISRVYRHFIHFILYDKTNGREEKFARLEFLENNKFIVAYLRHNDEWFNLTSDEGTDLQTTFKMISQMYHFVPVSL